jgi:hypothetical protein
VVGEVEGVGGKGYGLYVSSRTRRVKQSKEYTEQSVAILQCGSCCDDDDRNNDAPLAVPLPMKVVADERNVIVLESTIFLLLFAFKEDNEKIMECAITVATRTIVTYLPPPQPYPVLLLLLLFVVVPSL